MPMGRSRPRRDTPLAELVMLARKGYGQRELPWCQDDDASAGMRHPEDNTLRVRKSRGCTALD